MSFLHHLLDNLHKLGRLMSFLHLVLDNAWRNFKWPIILKSHSEWYPYNLVCSKIIEISLFFYQKIFLHFLFSEKILADLRREDQEGNSDKNQCFQDRNNDDIFLNVDPKKELKGVIVNQSWNVLNWKPIEITCSIHLMLRQRTHPEKYDLQNFGTKYCILKSLEKYPAISYEM